MVVLHLVLQRDQRSDGIKQWQAAGLIDDQPQVSHEHSHVHGPAETRGTPGASLMTMTSKTQAVLAGFPPTGPGFGIEGSTPEKPEPLTLGQVSQKSFVLSYEYHRESGEVGITNPFCK